jgi:hypothetical protein
MAVPTKCAANHDGRIEGADLGAATCLSTPTPGPVDLTVSERRLSAFEIEGIMAVAR